MKFFAKLFLCTVLVLTAALSLAEYYTVSSTLDNAVTHQVESELQQHQLVKYALQSGMLTASHNVSLDDGAVTDVAEQTAGAMGVALNLQTAQGTTLYDNLGRSFVLEQPEAEYINYQILRRTDGDWLVTTSAFSQSGFDLELTTLREMTSVFAEAEALRQRCQQVFLVATAAGSLVILVLSWFLTRPVKRLDKASRAFASGDYSLRITTHSRDEIGDLTRTYNAMADTIQEKIRDLELTVRQREDFVANFAHEMKTPMTSIIGYADTLYQRELPPDQVREAAGYILGEGMRLEALSFKLLELITLERQDFLLEEMELVPFLRDVEETILPTAQKRNVTVTFHCDPGVARIEYDLLKTMLLNLLDNALKSGGNRVAVTGLALDDHYLIDITDNGRGIPQDQLGRITEAFYMVDKSRSRKEHGAGLGLALCVKIAAIHGTKLDYISAEGEGTSVAFSLALSGAQEAEE